MTEQQLYTARSEGFYTCRIPVLIKTKNAILACCEARFGKGGDFDGSCIMIRRSTDDGKTFSEPYALAKSDNGTPMSNLVLIWDGTRLHATYCNEYLHCYYVYSDDEGATFSAPREITDTFEKIRPEYDWHIIATGPGHSICTKKGRMVIPVWLAEKERKHRPSVLASIYSDDGGATWEAGEVFGRELRNPSETAALELLDGRILFNIRTENRDSNGRRMYAISEDGAGGWSAPQYDEALLDPVCFGTLIRHPQTKDVLFVNPDNVDDVVTLKNYSSTRKNLTVQLSSDDCKTWTKKIVLEPDIAGYSDIAIAENGDVLVLFEYGALTNQYDNIGIRLVRFSLDEMR